MRVLIGCEESGKVRDAFAKLGHDAWSCDLVPARNGGKHLQCDVFEAIKMHGYWDLIILHPPCTALAVSGNRWYGEGTSGHEKRLEAIYWTRALWTLAKNTARVGCAIENPVGVLFNKLNGELRYYQPWMFGHGETKKTGIMTFRLDVLEATNIVDGREQKVWRMPPSSTRARDRSETYQGIADAMATQWGSLCSQ